MNSTKELEEIANRFRIEFDELGLKAPKNSLGNLERELIVDYWLKAIKQRETEALQNYRESLESLIDSLEIDREATEKHIRSVMKDKTEDEIEQQLLSAAIDADDRHDTLNDVREALNKGDQ